jgi:tetratricopeptide (TPR) repeat protein
MGDINQALDQILTGQEFTLPKIPVTTMLVNALESEDIASTIEKIKSLYKEQPDTYVLDENNLNAVGYEFLNGDQIETALKVFAFNVEMHPNSSNVYDSYGEGLLKQGDTAQAIKNYLKSVQLNPNNTNGLEFLEKLGVSNEEALPKVEVTAALLDTYVGKYKMNAAMTFTISREGNQLFILPTGQSKSALFPASENRFYSKIVNAQLTFHSNDDGEVTGLTLHQGGDFKAEKIE